MVFNGLGVWFIAIRTGTGSDVFTKNLCAALRLAGVRAEVTWLPHRAEYLPWSVQVPTPPMWATIVHINTWLHERFIPNSLPVVTTSHHVVHDPNFNKYKNFLQKCYHRFWIKNIEKRVFLKSDVVVAVSEYTSKMLKEVFGLSDVRVIYNGIDSSLFVNRNKNFNRPVFKLLYVGSWISRKGVDVLGPLMERLGAKAVLHYTGLQGEKNKNLPSNCKSLGRLNDSELILAMQDADVLVFPSYLEGFGLVAAEAMSCGTPVVAAKTSALVEVIEDGVTGILCDPGSVDSYENAVLRLIDASEFLQVMSFNARNSVEKKFDNNLMVRDYLSVYYSLVNGWF